MRALDQQCFVAGCSPARDEKASYVAYGHSLVCNPWGEILTSWTRSRGCRWWTLTWGTWPSTGVRSPSCPAGEATCTGPRTGRNPSNPTKERDAAMYYYNSAYTTYNYAAGALGILVVAVVLTALLLVLVLRR